MTEKRKRKGDIRAGDEKGGKFETLGLRGLFCEGEKGNQGGVKRKEKGDEAKSYKREKTKR